MTPSQIRQRLQQTQASLNHAAQETILENKDYLIGLVIDQQYNESVDSEGNPLRQYSEPYRLHKELAGTYRGKTDFQDTGEFHGDMNLRVEDMQYFIESSATTPSGELKSEILEHWQGAAVMELTAENKALAKEYLTPLYLEKVNLLID